ncbi:MAG: GNAT family N-acetyltransferase [Bacilli bacterium]|jgi:N-acetylglutamate synthase-like GNAT family acetyltransferase|nr:GNAT family N-acetyltransferase [Bacilli bacterium]
MIELEKINEEIKSFLKISPLDHNYLFKVDNVIMGCGRINTDGTNKIEFLILNQYRGNGYGEILFNELIKEVKRLGYKEIFITLANDNIKAKRIVEKGKGLQISSQPGTVKYVIPIV